MRRLRKLPVTRFPERDLARGLVSKVGFRLARSLQKAEELVHCRTLLDQRDLVLDRREHVFFRDLGARHIPLCAGRAVAGPLAVELRVPLSQLFRLLIEILANEDSAVIGKDLGKRASVLSPVGLAAAAALNRVS